MKTYTGREAYKMILQGKTMITPNGKSRVLRNIDKGFCWENGVLLTAWIAADLFSQDGWTEYEPEPEREEYVLVPRRVLDREALMYRNCAAVILAASKFFPPDAKILIPGNQSECPCKWPDILKTPEEL